MSLHRAEYLDFEHPDPLVAENRFRGAAADRSAPPTFEAARGALPAPSWAGHADAIAAYWTAWELAFRSLRGATAANGFVAAHADPCFNGCLFLWDTVFILAFGKYGERAFAFQRTLDNLYAKQHGDGFITRELRTADGTDQFHRHDPASTGPNVLAWSEYEYYLTFGDRDRLARVFPVLLAYHGWLRRYRSWPDGSYHSCGLACGMDNQPRIEPGYSAWTDHCHMAWIDATSQALLSARLLVLMAEELGQGGRPEVAACRREVADLSKYIHEHMWDESRATFCDRRLRAAAAAAAAGAGSDKSSVCTIGAYWTLLADAVVPERLPRFLAALDNPVIFNRPVRVPSLGADHEAYSARGGYWLGGVWPPTNYMVLRGLTHVGADDLAADIGRNYHDAVVRLFTSTHTLWENMAPEHSEFRDPRTGRTIRGPRPGEPAKPDFVGWGGLPPITVLFEYVFGIRPNVPKRTIIWDVRLLDAFGVDNYPFGTDGTLSLHCAGRGSFTDRPTITVKTNVPLTFVLRWGKSASLIGGADVHRDDVLARPASEVTIMLPAGFDGDVTTAAAGTAASGEASAAAAAPASAPAAGSGAASPAT